MNNPSQTGEPRRSVTGDQDIERDVESFKKKKRAELKAKALNKKKEYTGKKGEYTKTKQVNFMKVHPLDRI